MHEKPNAFNVLLRLETVIRVYRDHIRDKNLSGDEIANVNFLRRYGTYVLQNTKKENLLRLTNKTIASQVLRIQS